MASAFPFRDIVMPTPAEIRSGGGAQDGLLALFLAATASQATDLASILKQAWQSGYERAPALMVGLGVLAAVPPLALLGHLIARIGRRGETGDRTVLLRRKGAADPSRAGAPEALTTRLSKGALAWSDRDGSPRRLAITRELVRIGREPDNDIVLDDRTVHRYHAAIHRPDGTHTVVTDLSGPTGNGVMVNGRRTESHGLKGGDVIELGAMRLMYTE